MDKVRKQDRLEAQIQEAIENKLKLLGWFVKSTHGNIYQFGFPDLYIAHRMFGARWIEVKNPKKYQFQQSQIETFQLMNAAGVGVWVATDENQVPDILTKPQNWYKYYAGLAG